MNRAQWMIFVFIAFSLGGCGGQSGRSDLDQYMADMKAKPSGTIDPLPTFKAYEAFTYSASGMRSPFEPPVRLKFTDRDISRNVKPDLTREKQFLEQFDIESISLVGSISNDDGLWGLVRSEAGVHRVKVGDYIGRNHGRVDYVDEGEIRVIEIIPAGAKLWIERPRSLVLNAR